MSDFLIESISKESLEQINKMIARLNEGIESVIKMNEQFKGLKLPSEVSQGFSKVKDEVTKSNKTVSDYVDLQKKLANTEKQLIQSKSTLGKQIIKNSEEIKRQKRELTEEARLTSKNTSIYDKVNLKLNSLIKTYRDLAIRKEAGRKLSLKEEAQFASLEKRIFKYDRALKKVDAQSGRFNRSVGSYGKQFDGLGFSIAQITREAPAFANSIQTGFMAISNNIPMAIDEIQKLRNQNKALVAEGKPTRNVLRSIGAAIFSWQTLLSVGVTLLTIYGDEIVEWVSSLGSGASAADKIAESTAKVNEEANKLSGQSIGKFKALITVINDETKAEKERFSAKKELADEYPDFNQKILDEADATDLVSFAIDDYLKKLKLKAKGQAALALVQEKYTELLQKEADNEKFLNKITNTDPSKAKNEEERNEILRNRSQILENLKKRAENEIVSRNSVFNTAKQSVDQYNDSLKKQAGLQDEINALLNTYSESYSETDKKIKNGETPLVSSFLEPLIKNVNILKKELSDAFVSGEIDLKTYQKGIKDLDKSILDMTEGLEAIPLIKDPLDGLVTAEDGELLDSLNLSLSKTREQIKAIRQAQYNLASEDILFDSFGRLENQLGIQAGTFESLFEGIRLGFDDAGEAAQAFGNLATGVFANITAASNERLKNEQANLEIEKATAIEFAGDSQAAREEIERRFDQRQKEIRRKQVQNEKAQALFEIGISTAVGVIKALAMTPPNIPLSIAIGGIGLAQAAIVASRPIPQFKDGVRGFEGGLAMINDQKGSNYQEIVRTPDGKMRKYSGRDILLNLPKGSDVLSAGDTIKFENEMNNILGNSGINPLGSSLYGRTTNPMIINAPSGGLTETQMRRIMQDTLSKQPKQTTVWDKKGVTTFVQNGHSKKVILNNKVTFIGQEV